MWALARVVCPVAAQLLVCMAHQLSPVFAAEGMGLPKHTCGRGSACGPPQESPPDPARCLAQALHCQLLLLLWLLHPLLLLCLSSSYGPFCLLRVALDHLSLLDWDSGGGGG